MTATPTTGGVYRVLESTREADERDEDERGDGEDGAADAEQAAEGAEREPEDAEAVGIDARNVLIDPAQWQQRQEDFDYDIAIGRLVMSLSPSVELRNVFSSEAAASPGALNLSGVADPAVDELIELIIASESREELQVRVRALDRVLRAMHIWVPNWHKGSHWIAYWDMFGRPEEKPPYDRGLAKLDYAYRANGRLGGILDHRRDSGLARREALGQRGARRQRRHLRLGEAVERPRRDADRDGRRRNDIRRQFAAGGDLHRLGLRAVCLPGS